MKTIEVLNKQRITSPGKWREEAEYRRQNSRWLKYSAMISLLVKQRMSDVGMTQVALAEKLNCTQQHISMLLKGKTNLTLETIARLEEALDFNIIGESLISVCGYSQTIGEKRVYLNDGEQAPYGKMSL